MSVLVKGMEKPEHCGYCRFRYDGICHALQKTQYSMDECPLVGIDAVPVVRCKDCKHYDKGTIFPCGIAADFIVGDDDYCSSAERKEECTQER